MSDATKSMDGLGQPALWSPPDLISRTTFDRGGLTVEELVFNAHPDRAPLDRRLMWCLAPFELAVVGDPPVVNYLFHADYEHPGGEAAARGKVRAAFDRYHAAPEVVEGVREADMTTPPDHVIG